MPRLRRAVTADLRRRGMPRERALACAVRLLDLGFFRVGGEVYAEENESFGLATVRREHVTLRRNEVVFDFPAKSGQRRVQSIRDPAARRALETMRRRRSGPEDLLAWRDGEGEWHDVRSADVNDYIKDRIGEDYSAKDFRTWHGTVLAAVELAGEPEPASEAAFKRSVRRAIERVSEALGNTPRRLPPLLRRPPGHPALPRRRDDQPPRLGRRPDERQGPGQDRARSPRPDLLARRPVVPFG
ncbi:MAG: hypothetical protein U0R71_17930, partial [Solirubrobacterales bacterium]